MSASAQYSPGYSRAVAQLEAFRALIMQSKFLTPSEMLLSLIAVNRDVDQAVSVSVRNWTDWTGLSAKSRELAIRGLQKKSFDVQGRGDGTLIRFNKKAWEDYCRTADRTSRPHVEQKRAPAKPGQMIHPECRKSGCYMARQAEGSNLISIADATPNRKPVSDLPSNPTSETSAADSRAAITQNQEAISCPGHQKTTNSTTTTKTSPTTKCTTKGSPSTTMMKMETGTLAKCADSTLTTASATTKRTTTATKTNQQPNVSNCKSALPATPNRKPVSNSAGYSPAENSREEDSGSIPNQSSERAEGRGEQVQAPALPEGFKDFIGLFLSAGKPLNERDINLAKSRWKSLSIGDKRAAFKVARDQLQRTIEVEFIPLPVNFLTAKAWTREGVARTLPVVKPEKKNKRASEQEAMIQRVLNERS